MLHHHDHTTTTTNTNTQQQQNNRIQTNNIIIQQPPLHGLQYINIHDFLNHSKIMHYIFRAAVVLEAMHNNNNNNNKRHRNNNRYDNIPSNTNTNTRDYRYIITNISKLSCFQRNIKRNRSFIANTNS